MVNQITEIKLNKDQLLEVENRKCKLIKSYYKKEKNGKKLKSRLYIKYICKCGAEKEKRFDCFTSANTKRSGCRTCNMSIRREKPADIKDFDNNIEGEVWKTIPGGYICNLGRFRNIEGKITSVDEKYRVFINGEHCYLARLVAKAFQIENYDLLDTQKCIVKHIDNNSGNCRLDNLKIIPKQGQTQEYKRSERYKEKIDWEEDRFFHLEYKKIPESKHLKIYENGEIFNGRRFLAFTKRKKYYYLTFENNKRMYVHRLVCYAFHPIPGYTNMKDYKNLQVNHKDGNGFNNHKDNLEWCTQSENMKHAYKTLSLNKKLKKVIQLDLNRNFINIYSSISEANNLTGEPEHRISQSLKKQTNSKSQYIWEHGVFVDYEDQYYYTRENKKIIGSPFSHEEIYFLNEDNSLMYTLSDLLFFNKTKERIIETRKIKKKKQTEFIQKQKMFRKTVKQEENKLKKIKTI
jgi:hypothetical protein